MSRRVILADGAPPAALAAARSLVRAGFRVEATDGGSGDRAPRSRGVLPLPLRDGLADAVLRACSGERPLVLPTTDAALLALEPRRAEIEAVADYLAPPAEALRRCLDKEATLAAARAAGLSVPDTVVVRTAADAAACRLEPPLVLKPLSSRWRRADGSTGGAGPSFGRSAERASALLSDGAPGVLVQRWVPGTGRGVGLLVRGGRTAAIFVHRRIREVHPAGGPSSAAVSEPPDPALVGPAEALLREIGFEGLAMVEFRREGTGTPVLMEVNPRPWGTLGLAVDAGVDFPRLWAEGWTGPPPAYRAGVKRRWLAGDLRRVRAAWAGPPRDYPGPFPSFGRAVADVVLGIRTDFVFRWSDPMPFLAEFLGTRR